MENNNRRILAVSAHPDDIEFSSGGTLLKMTGKGYEVFLVVATNGENGFKIPSNNRKERIAVRKKEQMAAARYAGIKKVFFLGYKDGFLKYTDQLRERFVKIIRDVKPSIIFSFDPSNKIFESVNLHHRDHRVISEVVFDAVFAARNRYMYPGKTHSVDFFYFYGCDRPNYFENITSFIDKKIKFISFHRSQYYDLDSLSLWVKKNLSNWTKKYKYSEKFRIVKIKQPFITNV
ncbi:MAG: PIG-L family deacetylase [Ignavibacteria bacterium]|nr:PIG-L family deacetylase [Ignavibacteria bacterium]